MESAARSESGSCEMPGRSPAAMDDGRPMEWPVVHCHVYKQSYLLHKTGQRIDTLTVPFLAIRETVLNMLAHRSWWDESESLSVAIFDDRIELTNPGHFPIGTSVEDFIEVPRSKPQNPDIANVLFRSGWMESWGRGIIKAPWVTRIVFKFKNPLVPYISGEIDNDPINEGINEGLKGLSEMIKNTYHLIAINPGISVPQIAFLLSIGGDN